MTREAPCRADLRHMGFCFNLFAFHNTKPYRTEKWGIIDDVQRQQMLVKSHLSTPKPLSSPSLSITSSLHFLTLILTQSPILVPMVDICVLLPFPQRGIEIGPWIDRTCRLNGMPV